MIIHKADIKTYLNSLNPGQAIPIEHRHSNRGKAMIIKKIATVLAIYPYHAIVDYSLTLRGWNGASRTFTKTQSFTMAELYMFALRGKGKLEPSP